MKKKNSTNQNTPSVSPKLLSREAGLSYSVGEVLLVLTSFLFVIIAVMASGEGYASTQWYRYCSYLLPQVCLATTAVVYFVRTKQRVSTVAGGCKWYYFAIALLLQFGLLSLSELNVYFIKLLGLMGYQPTPVTLPNLSGWNLLPALLVIALLPAVFEELLFRGIMVGGMRRAGWGTVTSILLSGAMFSLFHGSPQQTVYQFVCGVCYALIAWRSGSILPTVLAHFCNNALILMLTRFGISDFSAAVKLPLYICSAICFIAVMVFLIFFDKRNNQRGKAVHGSLYFLYAAAGIVIALITWGSTLIAGFTNG